MTKANTKVDNAKLFKFYKKLSKNHKKEFNVAIKGYKKNSHYYAATLTVSPADFVMRFSHFVNLIATKNPKQAQYAEEKGYGKNLEKTPNNKLNNAIWGTTHWTQFGNTTINGENVHKVFPEKNKAIIEQTLYYGILTQTNFTCIDIDDPEVNLTIDDLLEFSKEYLNNAPIVYQTSSFGKKMHIFIDASKFPYKDGVKNFEFMVNGKFVKADIRAAKGYTRVASGVEGRYGDFKFLFNLNTDLNIDMLKKHINVNTYNKIANEDNLTGFSSYNHQDFLNLLPMLPVANEKLSTMNSMCLLKNNEVKFKGSIKNAKKTIDKYGNLKLYQNAYEKISDNDKTTHIEPSHSPFTWFVLLHNFYALEKFKKGENYAGYEEGNRNIFIYCLIKFGIAKCGLVYRTTEFNRFIAKIKDLNTNSKDIVKPLPNSEIDVIAAKLWHDAKNGYIKGLTTDQFKLIEQGTGLTLTLGHFKINPNKHTATVKEIMDKYGNYYEQIVFDYLDRPMIIENIDGEKYIRSVQKLAIDKITCNINESFGFMLDFFKSQYKLQFDYQVKALTKNMKIKHVHNNFKSDLDNSYTGSKDTEHIEKIKALRTKNNKGFLKLAFKNISDAENAKENARTFDDRHNTYEPIIPDKPNFKNNEHAMYRDAVLNVEDFVPIMNAFRQRSGRFKKNINYTQVFNILNEYKSIRNKLYPHDINYMEHIITLAAVIQQKRKLNAFEQKDEIITQIENTLNDLFTIEDNYNELHNTGKDSYFNLIEKRRDQLFDNNKSVLTNKEAKDLLYLRIDAIMDMYQYGFENAPMKSYIFATAFDNDGLEKLLKKHHGRAQAISEFKQEKSLMTLITEHMINLRNQLKIEKNKISSKIYKLEYKNSKQTDAKENTLNQDVIKQCYSILAQLDDNLLLMKQYEWMLSTESQFKPTMVKRRIVKRIFDSNKFELTNGSKMYQYVHETIEFPAFNYHLLDANQLAEFGLTPANKKRANQVHA